MQLGSSQRRLRTSTCAAQGRPVGQVRCLLLSLSTTVCSKHQQRMLCDAAWLCGDGATLHGYNCLLGAPAAVTLWVTPQALGKKMISRRASGTCVRDKAPSWQAPGRAVTCNSRISSTGP